MKKVLLTAMSLLAMTTASAAIDGTYTVSKATGYEVGDNYKFESGESWTVNAEEDETWAVEIAAVEGDTYSIANLIGWDETIEATYNAEAATLTIPGGTAVYDDEGTITYISGGLDGYSTPKGIMDYCDANNGWIYASRALKDIELKVGEDGAIVVSTPILVYTDYYPGYGYHGMGVSVYCDMELTKDAAEPEPAFAGDYIMMKSAGCYVGSNYKFSSGEPWEGEGEEEAWEVNIAKADEGNYTITNLLAWEESMLASFDPESSVLTIEGGTVAYVDEDGYEYKVCGGLEGYSTAQGVMDYCDANGGWIYDSRAVKNVELSVAEDGITLVTPILLYIDYYPGMSYHGVAYGIFTELQMVKGNLGINDVELGANDGVAEYYSINGMRIANPASGQIVIKRQGGKASKVIVR